MSDNQLTRDDIEYIAIHCSANKPGHDITAADIDRMHRKRGWRKIGYHFVIRRDGTVEPGRKWYEQGAHEPAINSCSTSVCMIGGVSDYETWTPEENYTDAQWASLQAVVAVLKSAFPKAQVVGHRDIEGVTKACPVFNAKVWAEETFG